MNNNFIITDVFIILYHLIYYNFLRDTFKVEYNDYSVKTSMYLTFRKNTDRDD